FLGNSVTATTAHILTTLAQCPEIPELQIYPSSLRDSDASDLPDRLELPHLRVLEIGLITPPVAKYSILSRISSPKYDHFRLDSDLPIGLLPDNLLESISHIAPSLVHIVASVPCVEISLGDSECQYSIHSVEHILNLDITYPAPSTVLEWITTVFGNAMKSVQADVTIERYTSPSENNPLAIGRIPLISSLKLLGRGNQTPITRHLSTALKVDGRLQWPFPELASLRIEENSNSPDEILLMLESRYGHSTKSKKADSKIGLPAPLVSFVIHGSGKTLDGSRGCLIKTRNLTIFIRREVIGVVFGFGFGFVILLDIPSQIIIPHNLTDLTDLARIVRIFLNAQ
ncbi:hypothetical protein FRB99_002446, partial [Tulasnella sp. 403]